MMNLSGSQNVLYPHLPRFSRVIDFSLFIIIINDVRTVKNSACAVPDGAVRTFRKEKKMTYTYIPKGVCSEQIHIETDDENNTIREVRFVGGCHGNTQGVCALVRGMDVDEVIGRLEGINCHNRGTSCPDQLSRALKEMKAL